MNRTESPMLMVGRQVESKYESSADRRTSGLKYCGGLCEMLEIEKVLVWASVKSPK